MSKRSYYLISMVSEMLTIHPQTIRQYERLGFITPARTKGNIRKYQQDDIDTLRYIAYLAKNMGINSAGIELIMEMRDQIAELEKQIEILHDRLKV